MQLAQFAGTVKAAYLRWSEDGCLMLGAALAYFAFGSLIPMLLVTSVAGAWLLSGPSGQDIRQQLVEGIAARIHSQALADAIMNALVGRTQDFAANGPLRTLVGFAWLIIAAAGFFEALSAAFALISAEHSPAAKSATRAMIRVKLVSFGFVGMMVLVVILLYLRLIALVFLADWLQYSWLWRIVDLVVSTATTTLLFALLFRYLSNIAVPTRHLLAGSLLAGIMWQIGQQGLSIYFDLTGGFSLYGVIGGVLAFLLYMYYWSLTLLFGAEFALVLAARRGAQSELSAGDMPARDLS
jgi:membrane protein